MSVSEIRCATEIKILPKGRPQATETRAHTHKAQDHCYEKQKLISVYVTIFRR